MTAHNHRDWVLRQLEDAARRIIDAPKGVQGDGRHDRTVRGAVRLAPYVREGVVSEGEVRQALTDAATSSGKGAGDALRAIDWGLEKGRDGDASYPTGSDSDHITWGGKTLQWGSPSAVTLDGIRTCAPNDAPMLLEAFGGQTQRESTRLTWTWEQLVEQISQPDPWPASGKDGLALWSPAVFAGGSRAKGAVVEAVSCLALDYDDDPTWSIEQAHVWWEDVRHVAHTSGSHMVPKGSTPACPRGRVIIALSRPVTWDEHCVLAEWVITAGRGKVGATELRSRGRCYYVPAEGPGGYLWGAHDPGRVLDVDAMLEALQAPQDEEDGPFQPLIVKVRGPNGWFLRQATGYAAIDGALLHPEMLRAHPSVNVWREDNNGKKYPMRAEELWSHYGVRADSLVYSMVADRSGFEPNPDIGGGTLTLPVCRRDARLVATYDADADEWLSQLTASSDRLRDWLATSLDLSRPTSALYLQGSDSVGKGMLAAALGRIYGRKTVAYKDVMGGFNSALKDSPMVYLDERAPVLPNGSAGFRTLIGDSSRELTEKYMPSATLIGCPRLIVAANNSDALRLGSEDLERADEEAIATRILHLDVSEGCKEWLRSRGGRSFTADWVEMPNGSPGRLCRHIAWLEKNWVVTRRGSRFLVEGDADAWLRSIGLREGLPRRVLAAIAAAASGVTRDLDEADWPVLYEHGIAQVRPAELAKHWQALTGEGRTPSSSAVGKAVGRIRVGPRTKSRQRVWGRHHVHSIPAALVLEVAEELGVGDVDRIRASFGLDVGVDQ